MFDSHHPAPHAVLTVSVDINAHVFEDSFFGGGLEKDSCNSVGTNHVVASCNVAPERALNQVGGGRQVRTAAKSKADAVAYASGLQYTEHPYVFAHQRFFLY